MNKQPPSEPEAAPTPAAPPTRPTYADENLLTAGQTCKLLKISRYRLDEIQRSSTPIPAVSIDGSPPRYCYAHVRAWLDARAGVKAEPKPPVRRARKLKHIVLP